MKKSIKSLEDDLKLAWSTIAKKSDMTELVAIRDKVSAFPSQKQNEEFKRDMKAMMEKVKKDNIEMQATSRTQIEII